MQSVSSRIWTRVAVSISYDDNDYTTAPPWTIWWWGSSNGRTLRNAEYPFIAIAAWPREGEPDMGQIKPFKIETVCKQMTYA